MEGFIGSAAPKIHYIDELQTNEPFYRPLHQHPDHLEFLFILEGTGIFTVNGLTHEVSPKSLIIYNQGVWHEEIGLTPISFLFFGFSNFHMPGLQKGMFLEPQQSCMIPLGDHFEKLIDRIHEVWSHIQQSPDDPYGIGSSLFMALLGEIASLVHATTVKKTNTGLSIVKDIKRYLEEHYHEVFSLDRLSEIFYLNKFYISRVFKKEMGLSPNHYMIQYRMNVAQYYLQTSHVSLEEIAERVGYQSVPHFQNVFKKRVGLSPGNYRKKNQRNPI